MLTLALDQINQGLPSQIDLFIGASSFEPRCLSIATRIADRTRFAVVVHNQEATHLSEVHLSALRSAFAGRLDVVVVSSASPTNTADVILTRIISRLREGDAKNVIVDVTTFTHEHLLILLALIGRDRLTADIQFAYTAALEYSTNTDENDVWLSSGMKCVRSVLGYPGAMVPSRRLHLIVLVGFESERAQRLIEVMEPTQLSLGVGDPAQSVTPAHHIRNERFHARLRAFLEAQMRMKTRIDTFTFSCIDPLHARDAIRGQASKFRALNTVICPMNTKISTIGAGLAAIADPRSQIVYAPPEIYNEIGYATPGDSVRLFRLSATDLRPR